MAVQGTVTGTRTRDTWLTFEWFRTNTSVLNNTSTLVWQLRLNRLNTLSFSASKKYSVKIGDKTYTDDYTKGVNWSTNGQHSTILASDTLVVKHDKDGTKTLDISANFDIAVTISSSHVATLLLSGSIELDPLIQPTTATLPTTEIRTGDTIQITLKPAKTTYTHRLEWEFFNSKGTIATDVTDVTSWTIPRALANQIPNDQAGKCNIICYTYEDTKLLGSQTTTFNLKVSLEDVPKITDVTITDTNTTIANKFNAFVQGYSKLKMAVAGTGTYSSTIKSYKVDFLGTTYDASSFTTDTITQAGALSFKITLTDSRDRKIVGTKTITVLEYKKPVISLFKAIRCDSAGIENESGEYINLSYKFDITTLNNLNDKIFKIEYKDEDDTTYVLLTSGSVYSADTSYISTQPLFDSDKAYNIRLTVSDFLTTSTYDIKLESDFVLIDYHEGGTGVKFGGVAKHPNCVEMGLPLLISKGVVSEWLDLEIADTFTTYRGLVENQPKIKECAGHVDIVGALSPKTTFTSSATKIVMVKNIPENLRPNVDRVFLCCGSNMERWECTVTKEGTITVARYGVSEYGVISTASRLAFSLSYNI